MPTSLNIAAALILAAVPLVPCMAQEYINGPLPVVESHRTTVIQVNKAQPASTGSTAVVLVQKGVQFDFKERLSNLQTQINNGLDKGWLKVGQAAAFSTEHD